MERFKWFTVASAPEAAGGPELAHRWEYRDVLDDRCAVDGFDAIGQQQFWVVEWPRLIAHAFVGHRLEELNQHRYTTAPAVLQSRNTADALVEIRLVFIAEVSTSRIHFDHIAQIQVSAFVEVRTSQVNVAQAGSLERSAMATGSKLIGASNDFWSMS